MTDHAFLPAETGITIPRPPRIVRTAAIDGSLARDSYVLGLEGVDAGREVEALQSFPRGFHDGIEFWLKDKLQHSIFLYHEVHATLQGDGPCEKLVAGRHYHTTAALFRALVDGLLDGLLVLGGRRLWACTILGNQIGVVRKLRLTDALLNLLVHRCVPTLGNCQHGDKQDEREP